MKISKQTEQLLAHLVINFSEGTPETRNQIAELLGLTPELITHLDENLLVDDDDGVHEMERDGE